MKIARHKPKQWRGPVFVNKTTCEVWASVPKKLGLIEKKGTHWYTEDGMRFISSHDASQYLLTVDTLGSGSTELLEKESGRSVATELDKALIKESVGKTRKQQGAVVAEKKSRALTPTQKLARMESMIENMRKKLDEGQDRTED